MQLTAIVEAAHGGERDVGACSRQLRECTLETRDVLFERGACPEPQILESTGCSHVVRAAQVDVVATAERHPLEG